MSDDRYQPQPLARWFWPAAIFSVLWFALGCAMYLYEVTLDPKTLELDMQAMMEAIPTWMWAAFATAVWVGLAGAVTLLMRRRLAVPLLGISLAACIVQNSGYFLDPELRNVTATDALVLPVVIIAITWTVFWFAYHSRNRGWLR